MLQDIDGAIMMFHKLHLMTEREERYLFNFCNVFVTVGLKKLLLLCMPEGKNLHFAEKSKRYSQEQSPPKYASNALQKISSMMVLLISIPCSVSQLAALFITCKSWRERFKFFYNQHGLKLLPQQKQVNIGLWYTTHHSILENFVFDFVQLWLMLVTIETNLDPSILEAMGKGSLHVEIQNL